MKAKDLKRRMAKIGIKLNKKQRTLLLRISHKIKYPAPFDFNTFLPLYNEIDNNYIKTHNYLLNSLYKRF